MPINSTSMPYSPSLQLAPFHDELTRPLGHRPSCALTPRVFGLVQPGFNEIAPSRPCIRDPVGATSQKPLDYQE